MTGSTHNRHASQTTQTWTQPGEEFSERGYKHKATGPITKENLHSLQILLIKPFLPPQILTSPIPNGSEIMENISHL